MDGSIGFIPKLSAACKTSIPLPTSFATLLPACTASPTRGIAPIAAHSGFPSAISITSPTPGIKLDAALSPVTTGPPGRVFSHVVKGCTILLSYQFELSDFISPKRFAVSSSLFLKAFAFSGVTIGFLLAISINLP